MMKVNLTEKEVEALVNYLGHTNDGMFIKACDWLDKDEARKQSKEIMRTYVKLADLYYDN